MIQHRCAWVPDNHIAYQAYHDTEWGVPVHDEHRLFEFLILEGAQAGLSWATILQKRAGYQQAYDGFDPQKVAKFDLEKQQALKENPDIVRNRLKIAASVRNAQAFLKIQAEYGSFDAYIWQFTDGKTLQNHWQSVEDVPVSTVQSDAMSKDLKKRGFSFVGTTICYAMMQAIGMVNDHTTDCFRHQELLG